MNRIYFFTGTGNSLHIAEEIAKSLSDCEIIAIQKGTETEIPAEMFLNYLNLAQNSIEAIEKGIEDAINSIHVIIEQGMREGVFFTESPYQSARTVYLATSVFINPKSFKDPDRQQNIESVVNLLIKGLKSSNK
jgi:hypothetical protein